MAEDDIYGNKARYERFVQNLDSLILPPENPTVRGSRRYWVKCKQNLRYFRKMDLLFRSRDLSFVRRLRVFRTLIIATHHIEKDLAKASRDDIDDLMGFMHSTYNSPKSKESFIVDLKFVWKTLFPETDSKGRPDETLMPYVVRHLSAKIDKSRQKMRSDKLSWEEFERLVDFFGSDLRLQCYLTLALESLGRPQELLYVRLRNIELFDNHAKVWIADHGKEGTGLLQCIDSYPYLAKWLEVHPLKNDPDAFLFVNIGNTNTLKQMTPFNVNKSLRKACKALNINKPVTCYSLKRNGVTMRRLRGESDMQIQHAARWSSTKQLKTYDLSDQTEAFQKELESRGLIPSVHAKPKPKQCGFCGKVSASSDLFCSGCKRPLSRSAIVSEAEQKQHEVDTLRSQVDTLTRQLEGIRQQMAEDFMSQILASKNSGKPMDYQN